METPRALMPAYDDKGGKNKWAVASTRPPPHKHLHDPVAAAGDGTGMGGDEPLIISMTTLPGRIHQIQATIMSLLEQSVVRQRAPLATHGGTRSTVFVLALKFTLKPSNSSCSTRPLTRPPTHPQAASEVVISVPKESDREKTAYPIPDWLRRLEARDSTPRLRIRHIDQDHGPATKLIPSVMEARERARAADAAGEYDGAKSGSGSGSGSGDGVGSGGGGWGIFGGGASPVADEAPGTAEASNVGNLLGNVLLLVVDDDTLYPPRLVETFLAWHRRLPDAALAFSGWPVVRGYRYPHWTENYLVYGNGEVVGDTTPAVPSAAPHPQQPPHPQPSSQSPPLPPPLASPANTPLPPTLTLIVELYAPHPVSIIRGNCGYLVQSRFFDEGLWDFKGAPKGAFYMDDVWISGRLAVAGVPRCVSVLAVATLCAPARASSPPLALPWPPQVRGAVRRGPVHHEPQPRERHDARPRLAQGKGAWWRRREEEGGVQRRQHADRCERAGAAALSRRLGRDLGRLELRNQAAREGLTAPGWIRMVPGVARGRVRLPGSSCLDRPAGSRGMPPAARRGARGRRS